MNWVYKNILLIHYYTKIRNFILEDTLFILIIVLKIKKKDIILIINVYLQLNYLIKSDYLNKDIHDTHMKTTPYELNYKPDLTKLLNQKQIKSIDNQINYLYKSILKILNLKCYQNDDYCFNLFGSDIMITNDYQIKFIELNKRPKLVNDKEYKYLNSSLIFNKILENIVDKQFPPSIDNLKKTKKTKKSKNTKSNEPKLIKL